MGGERKIALKIDDLSSEELIDSEDHKHVCRLSPSHPLSEMIRSVFSWDADSLNCLDIIKFLGSENVKFIVQNF